MGSVGVGLWTKTDHEPRGVDSRVGRIDGRELERRERVVGVLGIRR